MRDLGRRLEEARRRVGWTYRDVERKTGISKSTLQYLVTTRTSAPDYYLLTGLVSAFGETWDEEWESLWRRAVDTERTTSSGVDLPAGGEDVPAELPPDVYAFIGRREQLAELDRWRTEAVRASAPMVGLISGTAGVGKTSFAVHWAHSVRDLYDQGQLYVDLRGYDPDAPLTPSAALETLLRSLGVPGAAMPTARAERAVLYRSRLSDRRLLVVLDNAHTTEQVRDLLPGTPSCCTLVTSRTGLSGLVARYGARRLELDELSHADAVNLLRILVGDRVDAEPQAAAELTARCARLPLALRIAAELASARPSADLAGLVRELDEHRLEAFTVDDARSTPRAVFSWSIDRLPAGAAEVFRSIGLHPGPVIEPYAVAALADIDLAESRRQLETLRAANLIRVRARGGYDLHDLLRLYSVDLAPTGETGAARRLLAYYVRTLIQAVGILYPQAKVTASSASPAPPPFPRLTNVEEARAWLDAERPNLIAAVRSATSPALQPLVIELARPLTLHLDITAFYDDALIVGEHAVLASRAVGDRVAEAHAHGGLGESYRLTGRYEDAMRHYREELDLAREADERHAQRHALAGIGTLRQLSGDFGPALEYYRQALTLARETGDRRGERYAQQVIAVTHRLAAEYVEALPHALRALAISREIGDRQGEEWAHTTIGDIYLATGRHDEAAQTFRYTVVMAREAGDRAGESYARVRLGAVLRVAEKHEEAMDQLTQALDLARRIGHRDAVFEAELGFGEISLACERYERAVAHFANADTIATDLGHDHDRVRALSGLGMALRAQGKIAQAGERWHQALEISKRMGLREAAEIEAHLERLT